jgi:hypothetical protein
MSNLQALKPLTHGYIHAWWTAARTAVPKSAVTRKMVEDAADIIEKIVRPRPF